MGLPAGVADPLHSLSAADLPGYKTTRAFPNPVEASKRRAGGHGPLSLRDDEEAPVIRDLPGMCPLSVASDNSQLLDELAVCVDLIFAALTT